MHDYACTKHVTVPGKRDLIAHIILFLYRRCSATTPKKQSPTKRFCLSQWYLSLFAYTHAKFERVEALLKGQAHRIQTAT